LGYLPSANPAAACFSSFYLRSSFIWIFFLLIFYLLAYPFWLNFISCFIYIMKRGNRSLSFSKSYFFLFGLLIIGFLEIYFDLIFLSNFYLSFISLFPFLYTYSQFHEENHMLLIQLIFCHYLKTDILWSFFRLYFVFRIV